MRAPWIRWRKTEQPALEALFDADWYRRKILSKAPGVSSPLQHYLEHGVSAGLDPNPFFHSAWYSKQHPYKAAPSQPPVHRYLKNGMAGLHKPSPLFDPQWYLETYPDVARGRIDPFVHFLTHGRAEGRLPAPHFRLIGSERLPSSELAQPLASDFDFEPEDLLSFLPNYTVPPRVYTLGEPAFFTDSDKWWTVACHVRPIAHLTDRAESAPQTSDGYGHAGTLRLRDVVVLAGTGVLFDARYAFDDGLWATAPTPSSSFVFRLRRCARPILADALHLFASSRNSPLLRTAHLLARLQAAREEQLQIPPCVLVDDDLTSWTRAVLALAAGPAARLAATAPGQAFRVGSLLYPPIFNDRPAAPGVGELAPGPAVQTWFRKAKQALRMQVRDTSDQEDAPARVYLSPARPRQAADAALEVKLKELGFRFVKPSDSAIGDRVRLLGEADIVVAHLEIESADLLWPKSGATVIVLNDDLATETEAALQACAELSGFHLILPHGDARDDVDALLRAVSLTAPD